MKIIINYRNVAFLMRSIRRINSQLALRNQPVGFVLFVAAASTAGACSPVAVIERSH